MTNKQPKALQIANWIDGKDVPNFTGVDIADQAAAELRRLHEANEDLLKMLVRIRAEGPLMGNGLGADIDAAIAKHGGAA